MVVQDVWTVGAGALNYRAVRASTTVRSTIFKCGQKTRKVMALGRRLSLERLQSRVSVWSVAR